MTRQQIDIVHRGLIAKVDKQLKDLQNQKELQKKRDEEEKLRKIQEQMELERKTREEEERRRRELEEEIRMYVFETFWIQGVPPFSIPFHSIPSPILVLCPSFS